VASRDRRVPARPDPVAARDRAVPPRPRPVRARRHLARDQDHRRLAPERTGLGKGASNAARDLERSRA